MKRRPIPWGRRRPPAKLLGYAALLAVSLMLSCAKKEVESICAENCCDTTASHYEYITEIKDAEADYGNGGFWLKVPINGIHGISVCQLSEDKIKGLIKTFDPTDIANLQFAYRISGKIYDNIDDTPLGYDQIYDIRLSKAEKIK